MVVDSTELLHDLLLLLAIEMKQFSLGMFVFRVARFGPR